MSRVDDGCCRRTTARSKGFTLIEMMVVVSIIAIGAAFLLPSMAAAMRQRRLKNAGNLVLAKLNEARTNAISQHRPWSVIFLADGVRLFKGPKGTDPGEYVGDLAYLEPPEEAASVISYSLNFAKLASEDIPLRTSELDDPGNIDSGNDVFVRFRDDGTIDFNKHQDVKASGTNGDIVIVESGLEDEVVGVIDIKPTGRVRFDMVSVPEGVE